MGLSEIDKQRLLIVLVISAALLGTACTQSEGPKSQGTVTVNEYLVTPSTVYEGQNTEANIVLTATNTGSQQANLKVGEQGENILADSCPDTFRVKSFKSRTTTTDSTQTSYNLEPDEKASFQWDLDLAAGNIPLRGKQCDLKLELDFNYGGSSEYTAKIFESEQALEAAEISERSLSTSSGPIKFLIEPLPTERPSGVYVAGEDRQATFEFKIVGPKSQSSRAEILGESLDIKAEPPFSMDYPEDCEGVPQDPVLYNGETTRFTCTAQVPETLETPSKNPKIRAEFKYSYVKQLPTKTVEVKPNPES